MKIYAITPDFSEKTIEKFKILLDEGINFFQLRDKNSGKGETYRFFEKVFKLSEKYQNIRLMLNASNNFYEDDNPFLEIFNFYGIHESPTNPSIGFLHGKNSKVRFFSCHDKTEIMLAEKHGCEGITLSPVFRTKSHPELLPLGIEKCRSLLTHTDLPCYPLGGINKENIHLFEDMPIAGVAMISGVFSEDALIKYKQ